MSAASTQVLPVRFANTWTAIYFDGLRGLAAFFVLAGHWRNIYFVDYPQLVTHRGLWAFPYLLSGAGHQAVVFFFVLSGYFIGGTVLRGLERNQWEWSDYLLRRVVRLWTVLIPALLSCVFWDKLGIYLGHAPALYTGNVPNHIVSDVTSQLAPRIFFGNLFFLQTIVTPVLGSNGPLWSLANEFWYYVLFPLGAVALWPRTRWSHRLICTVLLLAGLWLIRGGILAMFPLWLGGVALFKLPPPPFSTDTAKYLRRVLSMVYLCTFFLASKLHFLPDIASDYLLATLTLVYLWILLSAKDEFKGEAFAVHASREAARFSYTLYAAHLPLLVFAASLTVGDSRWYPTPVRVFLGIGILLFVLLYSYGLACVTEFRRDAVRLRLEQALGFGANRSAVRSDPGLQRS